MPTDRTLSLTIIATASPDKGLETNLAMAVDRPEQRALGYAGPSKPIFESHHRTPPSPRKRNPDLPAFAGLVRL